MFKGKLSKVFLLCIVCVMFIAGTAFAKSAKVIDAEVEDALESFKKIDGAKELLNKSAGVLVFPEVIKAGVGIGGEYGEGALLIRNKVVDYYSTAAASVGFQLGGQKKTIIYCIMNKAALEGFQKSDGFSVGIDASVAVISVGIGKSIDLTQALDKPIVAFILDQKGLMYNLTLEGSKITKLDR